jgi:small subunit ribosomal protein S9e
MTESKTYKTPRRPYEKERIVSEIQKCGKYGLKNKREIWRVQLTLAKIRKAARTLLTLDEHDPKRLFEGRALLRRMYKYGLLDPKTDTQLDFCLSLTVEKFLERRLQSRVYHAKLAQSMHHARTVVKDRHISVDNQLVNVPSFLVTVENESKIRYYINSPKAEGRKSRLQKFKAKQGAN